jgi:phage portal protein BeeE
MKLRSLMPWGSPAVRNPVPDRKAASSFVSLAADGRASWTGRSYAALAREGFMRNPVAHSCVRLVSETTASVPMLL